LISKAKRRRAILKTKRKEERKARTTIKPRKGSGRGVKADTMVEW